ncbi:multisubunit potassium/proton antiporter PhaG subunit [Rhizobium sp. ERR 922]|uniref:Cation:proton antiporter n=1 Tax=Rhizobium dioscoreae TaxID=2653122 RepID=A0ABQ0Z0F7_9HYPH|nr:MULTISPECIES: monovalent cation/H(+) antiporter subunit G [Rhizobium]MCZ3376967.1 cation:proton antiporter [Rhizobium sp. AG207R]TWB12544.1 multisubunit potassium/proton antiporter PhaG subunit [Rhizobium sp. ERR1071]TWB58284.1 multisubunit potassium/proton antiporter PhaG subunit [Rhizobium sp. ERR 922]TWB99979.1 multisubunit potassium/proton antiporter PhaG subunit [Rhizobium sp. ERR 942]GES43612.1 cation:proton antiporter [Rhizobium dioscoreae]
MSTPFENIPLWAAIPVGALLMIGAFLTLIGAIGFLRLGTFYERIHAPTLGTSGGIGAIMIASMIFFSTATRTLVIHELLIGIFITVTTPITFMLLARAALHRDRAEQNGNVPPKQPPEETSVERRPS